jgi:hypothetical protein
LTAEIHEVSELTRELRRIVIEYRCNERIRTSTGQP